jgi:hypothetical protein
MTQASFAILKFSGVTDMVFAQNGRSKYRCKYD